MTTLGDGSLIGRSAHVALIEHVANELLNSDRVNDPEHVLVVTGEAGSGRSALLDFAGREILRSWNIARIHGHPAEADLPYAALQQLCMQLRKLGDSDAVDRLEQRIVAAATTTPLDTAHALLGVLASLSERRPLAVIVDDTHWLDPSSRQALTFAARRLDSEPVLVICTSSQHENRQIHGTDVMLELCPLSDADARILARRIAPGITASVLDKVVEWADGLPLAIVELAGQLDHEHLAADVELPPLLPVGPALSSLFTDRVGALSEHEVTALYLACSERLDRELMGLALDAVGRSLDDLAAAERAGLVRLRGDVWALRHPSLRTCVQAHTSLAQRVAVHTALADVLVDDPERRAPHLAEAALGPRSDVAAALADAAKSAQARGGLVEAAQFSEAAARQCTSPDQAHSHLAAAAASYVAGGASAQALRVVEKILRSGCDGRDWARWQSTRIACALWTRGELPIGLQEVTRRATHLPGAQGFEVLVAASLAYFVTGRYRMAREVAEQAAGVAPRGVGTPLIQIVTDALDVMVGADGAGQHIRGPWVGGVDDQTLADPRFPASIVASVLCWLDELEACERIATACERAASDESARTVARITTLPLLAMVAERRGQWSKARAMYREAGQLALDSDNDTAFPFIALRHAYLEAARGDAVACEEQRSRALQHARALTPALVHFDECIAGSLALASGEFDQAVVHLERARDFEVHHGLDCPGITSRFADYFEAKWRLGEHQELAGEVADFERRAERLSQPTDRAVAARCRALLAPSEESEPLFEHALALHDLSPQPFERARTHLAFAMVLRRARRKNDAIAHLQSAHTLFEQLGADAWLQTTTSELRACGQRRTDQDMQADCPFAGLTPREFEVSEVVAQGLTNPEAASRLFVSERTVEYHLTNAYRKLSVQDRHGLTELFNQRPS